MALFPLAPTRRLATIAALASTIAFVSSAVAAAEGALDLVFPAREGACWGRTYDAAHLVGRPAQKVKTIHVWDHWGKNGLFETPDDPDYADPDGRTSKAFPVVVVERTDRPGVWSGAVECRTAGTRLGCVAGEDDGVHFPMRFTPKGAALLAELGEPGVDLRRPPDMARLGDRPGEERLRPGADDRLFRLERRPTAECRDRLRAAGPDYARDGAPAVRALVTRALERSSAGGAYRPDAGRICLKGISGGRPLVAGFNPALGDYPNGVDGFLLRLVRGEGGAAKRYALQCHAREWEWRCEAASAGPDGPSDGDPLDAHLLRRSGGVGLVVSRALWSGDRSDKAIDPPIDLVVVETTHCPLDIWRD